MKVLVIAKTTRKLGFWLFESLFSEWKWIILIHGPDICLQNLETHPDFPGVTHKDEATCRSGSTIKCCSQIAWRKVGCHQAHKLPTSKPAACCQIGIAEQWSHLSEKSSKLSFTHVHSDLREMTVNGMQKDKVCKESTKLSGCLFCNC